MHDPLPSPANASRGRVLIIDDEPLISSVLRRILRGGHDVTSAPSAREALDLLAAERYDAVVCDLMMPEMTGMDFFEILRSRDPAQAERVLFFTGDAISPRSRAFLAQLGGRYLLKPFAADELRRRIQEIVDAT